MDNNPINGIDADGHAEQSIDSGPAWACMANDAGNAQPAREETATFHDNLLNAANQPQGDYNLTAAPGQPTAQTQQVTITYDKQAPPMQPKTEQYVEKTAEAAGVKSINISATTNGQHATNSNHYNGTAVDINKVDGQKVSSSEKAPSVAADVRAVQNAANSQQVGVAHENYGPAGLFKDGKPINNPKLQSEHQNHIHITIPRGSNDNN